MKTKKLKKAKFWKKIDSDLKKENKKLKEWMVSNYGKRCKEFVKGCYVCEGWRIFDKLRHQIG